MVQVTGDTWAPVAQKATLMEVVSDPGTAVAGRPARIIADLQPKVRRGRCAPAGSPPCRSSSPSVSSSPAS
ncbi:hypothetical protein [Streptomyces sp. NBC_00691]|uniref:hypothetical protein n=1 Tax=Streptomyces sp. NBC_00691 TaxID=2903671 RepID=UPI002E30EDF2|nr:hypothetical protein [Streptomyces sp. NBC_00691]